MHTHAPPRVDRRIKYVVGVAVRGLFARREIKGGNREGIIPVRCRGKNVQAAREAAGRFMFETSAPKL